MTTFKETIAKNLKIFIRQSGLTHVQIARSIRVSPSAISNWLTGATSIDVEHLVRICMKLNVPLDIVCGLKDDYFSRARTQGERDILAKYRAADDESRRFASIILTHGKQMP